MMSAVDGQFQMSTPPIRATSSASEDTFKTIKDLGTLDFRARSQNHVQNTAINTTTAVITARGCLDIEARVSDDGPLFRSQIKRRVAPRKVTPTMMYTLFLALPARLSISKCFPGGSPTLTVRAVPTAA